MNHQIIIDPHICRGKPCIKGTRIPVHMVLDLLEEGCTIQEIIIQYYPDLTPDDILVCIHYANSLVKNEEIHFTEAAVA